MKIRNWKKFQHFKNRNPPWIKLHRSILDQRDIMLISDRSFRILIGLWLLASEDKNTSGELPCIEDICFRLRKNKEEIQKALHELSAFIEPEYHDDIAMISPQYQDDHSEVEVETETEIRDLSDSNESAPIENTVSSLGSIGSQKNLPLLSAPSSLTKADQTNIKKSKTKRKKTGPTTDGSRVFQAYSESYKEVYGIEPRRSSKNYKHCQRVIERVGIAEALEVARYYPYTKSGWHVSKGHALQYLENDCESIYTEFVTGNRMTQTKAHEVDRLAKDGDDWRAIIEKYGDGSSKKKPVIVGECTVEGRAQSQK